MTTHRDPVAPAAGTKLVIDKEKQVVRDAMNTDQGQALIKLILDKYGYPAPAKDAFTAHADLGAFWVTTWLRRCINVDDEAPDV